MRPKEHYVSAEQARDAFEGFVRNWEFDAAVEAGTRQFKLKYIGADTIDRNPTPSPPGVVTASATPVRFRVEIPGARGRVGKPRYPGPPEDMKLDSSNPTALAMLSRLDRYHEGRKTLAAMSYFCLTAMEDSASVATGISDARKAVNNHYLISTKLLSKVAALSSGKGGNEPARSKGFSNRSGTRKESFCWLQFRPSPGGWPREQLTLQRN